MNTLHKATAAASVTSSWAACEKYNVVRFPGAADGTRLGSILVPVLNSGTPRLIINLQIDEETSPLSS